MQKKWNIKGSRDAATAQLAEALGVGSLTAGLLADRVGADSEACRRFLNMEEEMLHSPMLLCDMEKAVARIEQALQDNAHIVIYGDYDVDGVTSVSILYLYLKALGTKVSYYIPNRMGEGYGMSKSAVDKLIDEGAGLIVTVDTGITSSAEIEHAHTRGVDVVVTDHHECHGKLPDAAAVVNPRRPDCPYPFKELAGVGVVFKLLCAFEARRAGIPEQDAVRRICAAYADLVAIGTIADVMPIRDENRLIVAFGLRCMEHSRRVGLCALCDAVGKRPDGSRSPRAQRITSGFIGYTLAPRINAAGRISSAGLAVELFLTDSREKADALAQRLCDINRERQTEENRIATEAYAVIDATHDFANDPVIVLAADNWHHGVIGIVASRITEKYGLPSILISFDGAQSDGDLDVGKGSGRSVKGLNLVDALVHCDDLLEKYGGHELAAGLSVKRKNLPILRERLCGFADDLLGDEGQIPTLEYDLTISPSEATMRQAAELYLFEPFGVANQMPVFRMNGVPVTDMTAVGGGKHTKFTLKCNSDYISAMCFRHIPEDYDVYPGDLVDVLFTLDINEFQGNKSVQFTVKDLRLTEEVYNAEVQQNETFSRIIGDIESGNVPSPETVSGNIPDRGDFAYVYTLLKNELRLDHAVFSVRALLNLIASTGGNVGYVRLRLIILILDELGLIGAENIDSELEAYRFTKLPVTEKRNLEDSRIMKALRAAESLLSR